MGATWQTASATVGNTYSLSGVTLTGSNTLQVRVEDTAGNWQHRQDAGVCARHPAPTVNITDTGSFGTYTLTYTFTEAVSGFTASDVTVTNGSLSNFTPVNSTHWTESLTVNFLQNCNDKHCGE